MAYWERELQSILFQGYATKQTDAAMLFRAMCGDAIRLREKLAKVYDELRPEVKHANGVTVKPTGVK